MVVAFSGGADSAFLAWMAHDTLGPSGASAVTAVSASLAGEEAADCAALAEEWGLRWRAVETDELDRPGVRGQRHRPLPALQVRADRRPGAPGRGRGGHHRPRHQPRRPRRPPSRARPAAAERGAAFPLVDAGFTKADGAGGVPRAWACAPGTSRPPPAWRPASPTARRSRSARSTGSGRAEAALHRLGFRQVRVRHYGDLARLEVEVADLALAVERRHRGGGGGEVRRLPPGHPRPGGLPLRQPRTILRPCERAAACARSGAELGQAAGAAQGQGHEVLALPAAEGALEAPALAEAGDVVAARPSVPTSAPAPGARSGPPSGSGVEWSPVTISTSGPMAATSGMAASRASMAATLASKFPSSPAESGDLWWKKK